MVDVRSSLWHIWQEVCRLRTERMLIVFIEWNAMSHRIVSPFKGPGHCRLYHLPNDYASEPVYSWSNEPPHEGWSAGLAVSLAGLRRVVRDGR